jgi:DNA-binding response OmpR family regulator
LETTVHITCAQFYLEMNGIMEIALEQKKLLIVEDDTDTIEMLSLFFEKEGYQVLSTAWGQDALTLCRELLPDVILLDIRLPDIDGFEICRQLHDSFETSHIPVICLTEKREQIDKIEGLEAGAIDYVTKPFNLQELKLRVRNALKRTAYW